MGTRAVERGAVGVSVATNIRAVRERRGWSQQQLARRMAELGRPLATSAVAKVENGDRRVDVDDFAAFAAALNVSPARLMIADDDDPNASFAITPDYRLWTWVVWKWAAGEDPLYAEDELSWEVDLARRKLDYFAERPVWRRILDEQPVMQAFERLRQEVTVIGSILATVANRKPDDKVVYVQIGDKRGQERVRKAKQALSVLLNELDELTTRES